jgi:hypothetical protein
MISQAPFRAKRRSESTPGRIAARDQPQRLSQRALIRLLDPYEPCDLVIHLSLCLSPAGSGLASAMANIR